MDRQLHGGDTYGHPSALDFSSNTSPLGLPESVQKALAGSVGDWDGYPDPLCRDLTAAIAAADGVRDGLPSAAREGQLRADRHDPGQAEPRARPRDALQPQ